MTRTLKPDCVIRAHNVHDGSGRPDEAAHAFVSAMEALRVNIGVVTEAKALVWPLRDLARQRDLQLAAETPIDPERGAPIREEGDTVLIVRDVVARRSRVKVMTHDWVVRQYDRRHAPRRDQVVMLRGPVRGVWAFHGPPGGPNDPRNGAAWCEQMDRALAWAGRGGCRVIVGDCNATRDQVEAYIAAYDGPHARRVRTARVVGHGVDLCIVIGGTVDGETLDHGGSDHRASLYAVTATGPVAAMRRWLKKAIRAARRRRT